MRIARLAGVAGVVAVMVGWRSGWIARVLVGLSGTEVGQARGRGVPLQRPLRLDRGSEESGAAS